MIDPVFKELNLIKPLLTSLAIAISLLFIADRYTNSHCGCGGECECVCKTECDIHCKCGLIDCEGGGHEVIPTETM